MTIKHHLDDATLMSLSAGTLGEALTIVAATHVMACRRCRERVQLLDMIGGELVKDFDEEPVSMVSSDGGLSRSSDQLSRAGSDRNETGLPRPLDRIVGRSLASIPWKWLGPGVATHVLRLSDGAPGDLRLLRVAPGKKLPEHGHGGIELTHIISGAYRDEFGLFRAGDIADVDEEVEHQPIVEPGEYCICVVASEARARFKSPLSRLVQPLIGM
ncbi:MAG: ChrR family anti-sigma-E factor [Hyphomicrobiaceae bacterium]